MGKKILFISTLNLSTNPRILKEMNLALSLNYEVYFLGFRLGNWSDALDTELQKQHPGFSYTYLKASRKNVIRWFEESLKERLNRMAWKWNKNSLYLSATAATKRTFSLLRFSKKVKSGDYDLVVGHTLGAFYPASIIAGKAGCSYAVDMEDYHPGEHIEGNGDEEINRRNRIMKETLPKASYVSASSPLIARKTQDLCGLKKEKVISVLNYFPADEFGLPIPPQSKKLKLVWFSQFIGPGRGLEIVLSQWHILKENFELTLIGNSANGLDGIFQDGIEVVSPVSQSDLHKMLSGFDVGLALELSDRDVNRNIALTNKLFAYFQAGLYIVATDTAAQKEFIDERPGSGKLFSQKDTESFTNIMGEVYKSRNDIRQSSMNRYQQASKQNWEMESEKLKNTWQQVMN